MKDYLSELKSGHTTCVEIVGGYLKRIAEYEYLNAFIEVFSEEALERAKLIDRKISNKEPVGNLAGYVIGVKDVICYKGHQIRAASKILEGFSSLYSSTAIERLLAEDAIIIGSLNCDEFAMGSSNENSAFGPVKNAIDTNRVPGGSSGGSAVAVQADLCRISLGSDTGGSVRQPADFCGILGLKPTYGRISRYGLIAYASSFDQIGIFGKEIAEVASVLQVIAGPDEYDSTAIQQEVPEYVNSLNDERKYKIAYLEDALNHPGLDPEMKKQFEEFFKILEADGHSVKGVNFEYIDYIVPAYYVLTTAEASSNLSRYDGVRYGYRTKENIDDLVDFYKKNRSEGFGKEVKRRIMLGTFVLSAGYYEAYYNKAQQVRRLVADKTEEILANYDCIIMPTVPATAFKIGEKTDDPIAMYLADIYTVFANLVGAPAISLPIFKHFNGLPFGLQVINRKNKESELLNISCNLLKLKQKKAKTEKQ